MADNSKPAGSIIFLCRKESPANGNVTTVTRIKGFFESRGFECSVVDPIQADKIFWNRKSDNCRVFAINAWHCSSALKTCPYPFAIIFGGTDLNEYSRDLFSLAKMTTVVEKSRFLITFGDSMTKRVQELWSHLNPSVLKQIPQSVVTDPSEYQLKDHLKRLGHRHVERIFLLVASIRTVKDPLYLVPAFSNWHKRNPRDLLVIVGEKRDQEFYNGVRNCIEKNKGVVLFPELTQADLLACVRNSFALVNSSLSEGMSAAILEAMQLGTPVIARNVPGNTDLVIHKGTGFLYESPEDFISVFQMLTGELIDQVTKNAREMVAARHSCDSEAEAYFNILSDFGKD